MQLEEWLQSKGFDFKPILDGSTHRFPTKEDSGHEKSGWYIGSSTYTYSGKMLSSLHVSDWRSGEAWHFPEKNGNAWTEEETKVYAEHVKTQKEKSREEQEIKWAEAAEKSTAIINSLRSNTTSSDGGNSITDASTHPYVLKKKISTRNIEIYVDKSKLVIPLYQSEGEICGLQFIEETGQKRFLPGTRKSGAFFKINGSSAIRQRGTDQYIGICEGFATGCSLFQALQYPIFVAFDCGNLRAVSEKVRRLYPNAQIIVFGDDDTRTESNPGRTKACEAANANRAIAIFPQFKSEGLTDWNDLHCLEGIDEVKRQIQANLNQNTNSCHTGNGQIAPQGSEVSNGENEKNHSNAAIQTEKTKEKITPFKIATQFLGQKYLFADGILGLKFWRGEFYGYNGTHYEEIDEKYLKGLLQEWLAQNRLSDFIGTRITSGAMDAIKTPPVIIPERVEWPAFNNSFESARNIIPLKNGLLDIVALANKKPDFFKPHTPNFLCSYSLPFNYDPLAKCETYDRVVKEVLQEQSQIELWEEILGVHFYQPVSLEKFLLMYGEGRNGKSILLEVLRQIVGSANVSSVSLESFRSDGFMLHETLGKLANIISDLPAIEKVDEGAIKRFVSQESFTFNRKFKKGITCKPTAFLTISCNVLPVITDKSEGVWSRMIALEFKNQILDEAKQDKRLNKGWFWRQSGELPGIFNKAIQGLQRVMERGYIKETSDTKRFKDEYRLEMDSVSQFLQEHCEIFTGAQVPTTEAYRYYKMMCQHGGQFPIKLRTFTRQLNANAKRIGMPISYTGATVREGDTWKRYFYNVRLKNITQFKNPSEIDSGSAAEIIPF